MGFKLNIWIFLSIAGSLFMSFDVKLVFGAPQVPCYFIFGDSLVDNGNNNNLRTTAKANYQPYGVDFAGGATGRFTNNRTISDILAELLGFAKFIPSYATATGQDIFTGINYASGGAGIRDETSRQLGDRLSFDKQLWNHGRTVSRVRNSFRNPNSANEYLGKCLYTVFLGSNDYLNNYFMPQDYLTSRLYTPDRYADVLIRQFSQQLKMLYNYGARKIALFGLAQLGCIPALRNSGTGGCVDSINAAVKLFNDRLKPLVDDLNARLAGAKFIYLNTSSIQTGDPSSLGIQFLTQPCCPVDSTTGQCIPGGTPCSNRALYAYFDAIHGTDIVYLAYSTRAIDSVLPSDAYPVDIRRLAQQ